MIKLQKIRFILVFAVLVCNQYSFYREIELNLHQVIEHSAHEPFVDKQSLDKHNHDNENIHSDNYGHHHVEKAEANKNADHKTNSHDHCDELNFYNSHSLFLPQYQEVLAFFKTLPNFSDLFLLRPITYDYKNRISRPPCYYA